MFDIGEEVVCIDASATSAIFATELVLGAHYHIAWVGMYKHPKLNDEVLCVRLVEVRRAAAKFLDVLCGERNADDDLDMPFRATRFAPLRKTQTDISALRELTNIKERELEDA